MICFWGNTEHRDQDDAKQSKRLINIVKFILNFDLKKEQSGTIIESRCQGWPEGK